MLVDLEDFQKMENLHMMSELILISSLESLRKDSISCLGLSSTSERWLNSENDSRLHGQPSVAALRIVCGILRKEKTLSSQRCYLHEEEESWKITTAPQGTAFADKHAFPKDDSLKKIPLIR